MTNYLFEDIVLKKEGFLRGPFGGDLKKSLFVEKSEDTYKVYEQGVVLNCDSSIGDYYISKEYFDEKMHKFEVRPGDFLVSCSGVNYGAIYRLEEGIEKGIINQALLRIRIDDKIVNPTYFYYYFKYYICKKIISGTGDSTIPNFPPMSVIKKIELELPSITEQEKIGNLWAKYDSKLKNNSILIRKLQDKISLYYNSWFGNDFFHKDKDLVYDEYLEFNIPSDWKIQTLYSNDLFSIIKPGVDYFESKIYLPTSNVENDNFIDGNSVSYETRETRANMQPIANSIWVAKMKNTIKHLFITQNDDWFYNNYILSTGFLGLKCSNKSFPYVYAYISSSYFEKVKDQLAHGATQEAINNYDLKHINIIVPDDDTLTRFANLIMPIINTISGLKLENKKIENYISFIAPQIIGNKEIF